MFTSTRQHVCRSLAIAAIVAGGAVAPAAAQAPAPVAPAPDPAWTGTAGVGISLTSGNTDTMNYNLAADFTRTPKARNVMKWTALYLRGDQNNNKTSDRTSFLYRDEYTLSGRTFVFGQLDYLRDPFKRINYLVAPTAGVGYKVLDSDAARFAVNLGAGALFEKNPLLPVKKNGAVTAGDKLTLQMTPTAEFHHSTTALWKANDFADALYNVSAGIGVQISAHAQLSFDVLDSFKSRPPTAATKKNDVALITAVTAKF